jgi:hypothetical protein
MQALLCLLKFKPCANPRVIVPRHNY